MSSEIKANKLSPGSGNDVTMGDSGDTFTVPSGSAINVASGGDINVASGGEIDVASGATLDVNGTIDLTGAIKTGFPAGGLTQAQQWRISSNFGSTNTEQYFYANWEQPAAIEFPGEIGSDMVVDATTSATLSGAWTFPVTGTWFIRFFWSQVGISGTSTYTTRLYTTDDNGSSWVKCAETQQCGHHNNKSSGTVEYIFNVADVSNDKTRFSCQNTPSYTSTVQSNTEVNVTGATFLRLGDSS